MILIYDISLMPLRYARAMPPDIAAYAYRYGGDAYAFAI